MNAVMLRDGRQVTIRRAVPGDAAGLVALMDGCYRERIYYHKSTYDATPEQEAQRIAGEEIIFVAESEGRELVGWVDLTPGRAEFMRHVGSMGVGVAPAYRDGGLGGYLLETIIGAAGVAGLERITLHVNGSNVRAIRAYERAGFRTEGHLARAIKDGDRYDDVFVMGLLLH